MTKKKDVPAVDRFYALFASNTRSSGRYDPKRDRGWTEHEALKKADIQGHLNGSMGCGGVPIQDDDTCVWAALDLDNHDSDEDLPIKEVDQKLRQLKIPLIPCRSKSGGIHCYLFLDKPQPASRIRTIMGTWAGQIGWGGCEIFPKQARLGTTKEGPKQLGNWINWPYLGGDKTNRYAIYDGKKLELEAFLDLAEKSRQSDAQLRAFTASDHPDAPPCVQKMFANGVAQGHRNEGLYNIVVYLRKANPDGYEAKAYEVNNTVFAKPLGKAECGRTIASAGRPDYGYRCNEEPCRSLCDREACLSRKFGITPADVERLNSAESVPPFTDLVKYVTEPVRWEIKIDGVTVTNIPTEHLLDWRAMRQIIADRLTKIVPVIKNSEWERMLAPLMKEARIVEAPDDASVSGVVRDRLREFAAKTDLTNRGQDVDDRKALLRGMPVVQVYEGERCVVFRGQDFVNYLKRTKSEELKGINLWFAVKGIGVGNTKMRAGSHNINVWYLPVKAVLEHKSPIEGQKFESEL